MTAQRLPISREMLVNAITRNLSQTMPGYFTDTKHPNYYAEYGYPANLCFEHYWYMYQRNAIASAGVNKAIEKCWSTYPILQEREETHDITPQEADIAETFEAMGFWSKLAEADRYSRIGEYAGVVFRYRDSLSPEQPVARVPGGLQGLADIVPVLQGQLEPLTYYTDPKAENYGQVSMWTYKESMAIDGRKTAKDGKYREYSIHPDRVHIWSQNSTLCGTPVLQGCYNNLVDIQKVYGAGGEGFWKNAKAAPVLNVDTSANLSSLATALGVPLDSLGDKLDEVVKDYNRGLDSTMVLQGITPEILSVEMPSPEHFTMGPLQAIAAHLGIPLKILIGSQSGERASTEDAKEWNATCSSRRNNYIVPNIRSILRRLEKAGVLPAAKWFIYWPGLTESSTAEKMDMAGKMAEINKKLETSGEVGFTTDEIREVAGYKPLAQENVPRRPRDQKDNPESD